MNSRLQNKIDNYHLGKLTRDDQVAFEKELEADPSLMSESNFQKEIIEGLKKYRKEQLKVRLNNLKPDSVWMEFTSESFLLKSLGGVVIASLIGTGIYVYNAPNAREIATKAVEINAPALAENVSTINWNIEVANLPEESTKKTKSLVEDVKKVNQREIGLVTEKSAKEKELLASKTFVPLFDVPHAEKIRDDEAMEVVPLDELPAEESLEKTSKYVDVTTVNTKSLNIKFKYYDGKLFLNGDFDRAPYEILEINSANGRRIYVKYLDSYYSVRITDQFEDLPLVTNPALIEELELIRLNK